jgi:hypothetical protein
VIDYDVRIERAVARLREGGWSTLKVAFTLLGLALSLVVLTPVILVTVVSVVLTWTRLPGLHQLGHAIERHMTTPVLEAFIGAGERLQELGDKRKPPSV